jgi:hypothetical protein
VTFSDRLWIAWRIHRGELISFRADLERTSVTLEFRGKDRARLNAALAGEKAPDGREGGSARKSP